MRIEAVFEPAVQYLNHWRQWLEDGFLPVATSEQRRVSANRDSSLPNAGGRRLAA